MASKQSYAFCITVFNICKSRLPHVSGVAMMRLGLNCRPHRYLIVASRVSRNAAGAKATCAQRQCAGAAKTSKFKLVVESRRSHDRRGSDGPSTADTQNTSCTEQTQEFWIRLATIVREFNPQGTIPKSYLQASKKQSESARRQIRGAAAVHQARALATTALGVQLLKQLTRRAFPPAFLHILFQE